MELMVLEQLMLNVVFLIVISFLIAKLPFIERLLTVKKETPAGKAALALLFGGISICATYIGVRVEGVIVNTRVIGTLTAGLFYGPAVGIGAGLVAAVHRVFYDPAGFTTIACALSTLVAGLLGAMLHNAYNRTRRGSLFLVLTAAAAETLHMLLILLLSRPYEQAAAAVRIIAAPILLLNSVGLLTFVSVLNQVFVHKDRNSAVKVRDALRIAEESLPYMRLGLHSGQALDSVVDIILNAGICEGVIFTDRQAVLAGHCAGGLPEAQAGGALPDFTAEPLRTGQLVSDAPIAPDSVYHSVSKKYQVIVAPLVVREKTIGSMTLIVKRMFLSREFDTRFADGLARLFSTQLELAELDELKRQYRNAELRALRSQINPHFLYNALNTISCVCREQPDQARQLLLTLATHYRHILSDPHSLTTLEEEIRHVEDYLVLEKARFGSSLIVEYQLECDVHEAVPTFVLQPLIENAIKYGKGADGTRRVCIRATDEGKQLAVTISDRGQGFPQQVLENFPGAQEPGQHFGLFNVDRRLKYLYGPGHGLRLESSPAGAAVTARFPKMTGNAVRKDERVCTSQ